MDPFEKIIHIKKGIEKGPDILREVIPS